MSFSEYSGNKTKVSQTVGRIFKNAQDSFPKIPTTQAVGAMLKNLSSSGSSNDHERLSKSGAPSAVSSSKFGFQKFRLKAGLDKKKSNNPRAELLDNKEMGDHEDSADECECEFTTQYPQVSHTALIETPSVQKQKRWPF